MPSISHTKRKQRLALALRIEKSRRLATSCSYCRSQYRQCFINPSESKRCSECIRSKRPCDGSPTDLSVPVSPHPVCRFFVGGRTVRCPHPPTPPSEPDALIDTSLWFPAFDPLDPFWSDPSLWAGVGLEPLSSTPVPQDADGTAEESPGN